jgi:hypothetical protein
MIEVYDDTGKLFKAIRMEPDQSADDGFVLPSVQGN